MRDLSEIRVDIDKIDNEILRLFNERLELASQVAEYKIANNKPVFDKTREDEKIATLSSNAPDDFTKQGIKELFSQIMSFSRKKQYKLISSESTFGFEMKDNLDIQNKKVVFQGVEGAYSQLATEKFFGTLENAFAVKTWKDALEAIKNKEADFAVIPIENSSAGFISENYDLLLQYDFSIVGEQLLKVDHALLASEGAKLEDIKTIYSHPQALMQCSSYIEGKGDINTISVLNTALAAKKVKEANDKTIAAIASKRNADIYGLAVLEEAIQDNKSNETRFLIISANKSYLKSSNKISVCFELSNDQGSLYRILSHFIFNGLNLSKIESRPIENKNWEYRFFVDIDGNLSDEAVRNALTGILNEASSLKVLGNY